MSVIGIASPEAYARRAVESECAIVASTGQGRNDQLNRSAYSVGQLVGSGYMGRREAEDMLNSAAQASGYVAKDGIAAARATIKSGLEDGVRHPRKIDAKADVSPRSYEMRALRPAPQIDGVPLPEMTPPNEDGKPKFYAIGKEEPTRFDDEVRRHVYWRDGRPVRVKIKKAVIKPSDNPWTNAYRVRRPSDGAIGWQAKKPEGFVPVPYFGSKEATNPFSAEHVGEVLVWAEGEKDVDTLLRKGFLAFTFGSASDVPDCSNLLRNHHVIVVTDNDGAGEKSLPRKIEAAQATARSVKFVSLRDLKEGGDATDFFDEGRTAEDFLDRAEVYVPKVDSSPAAIPEKAPAAPLKITATPFQWRDPSTFPRRQWLYGYHLIRKFMSATVAPGGIGKTSLLLVEAVAMAAGRNLIGTEPRQGKLKVWVVNLEDPREEIERRLLAICLHFQIAPEEVAGHLFVDSGREVSVVVATATRNGTEIAAPVVDALKAEIKARQIDVLIVDPFVKAHRVSENDNAAIDVVATAFANIADVTDCAIELVHHVRKGQGGGGEITVEDGRGASALLSAVRSARVLNPMSKEEAEQAGNVVAREHFRVTNGKANLAPAPDKSEWFRLQSVPLGNGDELNPYDVGDKIGVVESWEWPSPMQAITVAHLRAVQKIVSEGEYRADAQCENWVGIAIAQVLGLDATNKSTRKNITKIMDAWFANKMFKRVSKTDERRKPRQFVEVVEWATD